MQLLEVGSLEVAAVLPARGKAGAVQSVAGGCQGVGECVGGGVGLQEGLLNALGAGAIPSTFGPEISFQLALA